MSREIKFRAWDEGQKYMAYQGTPDLETIQSFMHHFGDKKLLQFTALTDKNGKEIYEGDILKWRCSKSGSKKEDFYTVTIEWKKDAHGYSLTIHHKGEKWATQKSYWNASEREIIGNIYENPELLSEWS